MLADGETDALGDLLIDALGDILELGLIDLDIDGL